MREKMEPRNGLWSRPIPSTNSNIKVMEICLFLGMIYFRQIYSAVIFKQKVLLVSVDNLGLSQYAKGYFCWKTYKDKEN